MNKLIENLIQSGLEPKEAEIYLAVLQLGKASITDIARKSKVKRTTIYEHLEKLTENNLLHKTVKGKRILYVAENPNRLSKILEQRKKKISQILPELENIFHLSSHKPQIRFYEGLVGMRAIYDEMTKTSQTIYGAFSAEKWFSVFSAKDNDNFFQNIRENGGQLKDVIEDSPRGRKHAKSEFYKSIGSPKILPKDFNLSVDLMIAGDKVAMISLVNLVGVLIENPEIAELQRNFIKFVRKNC